MGRNKKSPDDAYTHDLRAKVPKILNDLVKTEAKRRGADKSQIVRDAVIAELNRLRALRGEGPLEDIL